MKFDLRNTPGIVFGVGEIARLGDLVQGYSRILLMYGGGSIKANGVHAQVLDALSGLEVHEFGGVEANPEYETAMAAVRLAREKSCDFVLGVGGGSVIDASKFVAAIIPMKDADPWDRFMGGEEPVQVVPNGAVLTLPATGYESNPVSVISRRERALKVPFPVFAILDPSTMKSLNRRQLENGVVDSVTHVLEQYVTRPGNAPIQIGYSEVLLQALFEWGPRLIAEDSDETRETVMWAANQALNGLIGTRRAIAGSSGPFYATALLRASKSLSGVAEPDEQQWRATFEAGVAAIGELGGAKAGDRTMLDALIPACHAWRDGTWREAVQAAETGAQQTAGMYPRVGRASYLGDRATGSPDAGAAAVTVWMGAISEARLT
ncbi:iron-containing alcohol dehydrogenase [Mesorhizobium sp. YC-39]|uniref:iron-containing alcohol dehydrogenase n=1 Tax=unclassified Mesorhizobium TaxID=325217 RepID=UPI0021E72BE8|nr:MULTISPECIES: iron-containing alcohol dehydrogenase [unclassified Mesorhizobium]MCV3205628.1 iron-containing alcohol dehydrogenase [Mesorhizobium sp. YC-2]MCV3227973.1 iron-containing alcohol dehydrogenase [Mesorhizobium sp. YC-39]